MLGVAIVGAGHWGPNLVTNFHTNARSRVACVVDSDPRRLEEVQRRFPGVPTAAAVEVALRDSEVDAVVIATPTHSHYELSTAALAAGKHVLVEKPMAASLEDARRLCDAAASANRVLMVGHVFLYNAAAIQVRRYLKRGELGRIYYISMVRTNLGPIRVDVNAAWDLAAHDISLANYWLGEEPLSISALGGSWINPEVEDAVFATLRYPDDVLVHLHASWLNPRKARDITVVGDERMLTFDDVESAEPIRIYDKQVTEDRSPMPFIDTYESFRTHVREGKVTVPEVEASEPLKNECEHFLDCVIDRITPRSGPAEGLAVVRALDALSRSLREGGREVAIDPD